MSFPPMGCERRPAFSLLEVVIVMALMVIIAAIASPLVFAALYGTTKVSAAADQVRASWATCRYQAGEMGRPYQFSVVPNSGWFKVEPYIFDGNEDPEAAFFMGDVGTNNSTDHDKQGAIFEDRLPEGIRFGTKDRPVDPESEESTSKDYQRIVVFWPDGTAQNDVEITFGSKEGGIQTIRLSAATGSAILGNSDSTGSGK